MEFYQIFIIFVVAIAIVGLIIWWAWNKFRNESPDEERNFGLSLFPYKHGGRAYGSEKEVHRGPKGQDIILLAPKDLSLKEIRNNIKAEDVTVIVNKGKKITFAKGFSKGRYINLYLPPRAEDLPEEVKQTPFGRLLGFYIEIDNAKHTEIDALREGFNRQAGHITRMGNGEISVERLNLQEELFNDFLKSMADAKKEDRATRGIFPGSGQPPHN